MNPLHIISPALVTAVYGIYRVTQNLNNMLS